MDIEKLKERLEDFKSMPNSGEWYTAENPQSIGIYIPCKEARNNRIMICCTAMSDSMKMETKQKRRDDMQLIVDTMNNIDEILQ